jgi:16S rRNA (cytidine1402-2'-O)-methyltransferase
VAAPARGVLHVVATPIGNLADVTLRALEVLRVADCVFAEDTRHTRRLLDRHGLGPRLVSAHAHNEAARARQLCERLGRGERVALVTDAGTPTLSDPGARLVAAAAAAGFAVAAVPGPSAVAAALAVSGLSADAFSFAGFLPARSEARRRRLEALLARAETIVFFEAPHRVRATLGVLCEIAPRRPLAACRELTKAFEEVLRGTPAEVLGLLTAERERGEWTLVLGPPAPGESLPGESLAEGARGGRAAGAAGRAADAARRAFERGLVEEGVEPGEAGRRADFVFGGTGRRPGPRKTGKPRTR